MNDNNVEPELQIRAKKYIQFITAQKLDLQETPDNCLNQLSPFLKDQI